MSKSVVSLVVVFWLIPLFSHALDSTEFVVGAQDINYFPHYSFKTGEDKGYAWALLDEFARQEGITLVYVALPIKRLQMELIKGTVDFAYPDNPKWQSQDSNTLNKTFSTPITSAMGGTMVLPQNKGSGIDSFRSLSVPLGFTPIMWTQRIRQGSVTVVSVKDANAALQMVKKGRVDGADIEYHVARYLLGISGDEEALVLDPSLPYDIVDFQLSTIRQVAILEKLNRFIASNPVTLRKLKNRYGLIEPETILSNSSSQPE